MEASSDKIIYTTRHGYTHFTITLVVHEHKNEYNSNVNNKKKKEIINVANQLTITNLLLCKADITRDD